MCCNATSLQDRTTVSGRDPGMHQYQWTLSARVNASNPSGSPHQPHDVLSRSAPTVVEDCYCITAPPSDPGFVTPVVGSTTTVLVEMFHDLPKSVHIVDVVTRIHFHIKQKLCHGDKSIW